jgi:phosphate transport system protein
MSAQFEQELDELEKTLLAMAGHAESAVVRAVKAMTDRDNELARGVKQDDSTLDRLEKEIDEIAFRLLAEAPSGLELRLITVAMKISNDLERVGDEATTIARRVLELNQEPPFHTEVDLGSMATLGMSMLKEALEAFVNRHPGKARAIIPRDKQIDSLNKQLQRELASYMVERPATISRCLSLMVISKSLERIGDHATNIAEEVVYLYEGEDIRHDPTAKRGEAPRG